MKYLIVSLIAIAAMWAMPDVQAQDKDSKAKVEQINVHGVCNACKKRIEKAALKGGAKMADWDKHQQSLQVIYNSYKVHIDSIKSQVANAGHDVDSSFIAPMAAYEALPGCCQYRSGITVH